MGITKKAKSVKVNFHVVKEITVFDEYACPTCKTTYKELAPRNVMRFRCFCGQELIVTPCKTNLPKG